MMSGNSAVHQHCRVGRLPLISGVSASSMDVIPFMIYQRINVVCGVNVIGMRRAGICAASIEAVRKAYHILFLGNNVVSHSLMRLEAEMSHIPEVMQVVAFIRAQQARREPRRRAPGRVGVVSQLSRRGGAVERPTPPPNPLP